MQAAVYTLLVSITLRSVISHNATISKFTTGKNSNLRNWHGHFVVIPAKVESVFFICTLKERKQREWKTMIKE